MSHSSYQVPNIEISTAPVVHAPTLFAVKALEQIHGQFRAIKPGEFVLIDPDAVRSDGKLVLVGLRLEPWCGQQEVRGVAVKILSDDV